MTLEEPRKWQTSRWRKWRWGNKVWAHAFGFFWKSCPSCGTWFGGHESGPYALIFEQDEHHRSGWILCWKHDCNEFTADAAVGGSATESEPAR